MRKVLLVLPVLLAISIGVATAMAGGGKSATAMMCQKGGWMSLQGSDGTHFASEEACVSFGAQGGTIVPIPPSISISFTPTGTAPYCYVTANLSHFAANMQYQVSAIVGFFFFTTEGPFSVTTDSSGAGSVLMFSAPANGDKVQASVGSVSSSLDLVTC
jgi:hypothetical protein